MTPEQLPIEQYDAQLAEKVSRLQAMMAPFAAPEVEVFRSPVSHYRMRAEFRIWHDGDSIFFVKKSEKRWKFYIDFRKFNDIIKIDQYLLSFIDKMLDKCKKIVILIKMDICQIFNKIRIYFDFIKFIIFKFKYDIYQYNILFFDFCNKSTIF